MLLIRRVPLFLLMAVASGVVADMEEEDEAPTEVPHEGSVTLSGEVPSVPLGELKMVLKNSNTREVAFAPPGTWELKMISGYGVLQRRKEEKEQEEEEHAEIDLLAHEEYSEGTYRDVWTKSTRIVIDDDGIGVTSFKFPPLPPKPTPETSTKAPKKEKKQKVKEAKALPSPPLVAPLTLPLAVVARPVPGPSVAPLEAQALCARTNTSTQAAAQQEWAEFQQEEELGALLEATEARLAQRRMQLRQERQAQQLHMNEYYNEVKRREEGGALEKSACA